MPLATDIPTITLITLVILQKPIQLRKLNPTKPHPTPIIHNIYIYKPQKIMIFLQEKYLYHPIPQFGPGPPSNPGCEDVMDLVLKEAGLPAASPTANGAANGASDRVALAHQHPSISFPWSCEVSPNKNRCETAGFWEFCRKTSGCL